MNAFDISVKRFDEFASEFADKFKDIDAYKVHFNRFCELTCYSSPKILELGCGPGNVTGYLKEKMPGSQIIAIDLAPRMIEIARRVVPEVDFRVMDVRSINLLEGMFDSIMCSFCLPFLSKPDTEKLINDCSRKLVKGGILYLSTMEGDGSKAGFEPTSFSGDSKVYFNYHTKEDMEKTLLESGFEIEHSLKQDYSEPDGTTLIDLIIIARKK